jgi:hypothetical protein
MNQSTKIRWVSLALQYLCYVFLGFIALLIGFTLFDVLFRPENLTVYLDDGVVFYMQKFAAAPAVRAWPATLITWVPTLATFYAFWRLSRLFGQFKVGVYFTEVNAQHLFIFALLCFFAQLLAFPVYGIADLILTIGTDTPATGMPLRLDGDEISNFVIYGSFLVIAWILREAIRLADENAEFV